MKLIARVILTMTLVSGVAFASDPEIRVIDGKVSISADAVPLGLLLSLLDRATGLKSEVKATELANRSISVRVTGLELRQAVRKIFEGQPVNYMFIEGRGILVTEASQPGTGNTPSTASLPSSFQQPVIVSTSAPPQAPVNALPPAAGSPFSPAFGAAGQPSNVLSVIPSVTTSGNSGASNGPIPGQIAPAIGTANPFAPAAVAAAPSAIPPPVSMPAGPSPGSPGYKPPDEPAGPGTLGGVRPGVVGK